MDDVEYDRCRRAKAKEWGIRLATLDRLRKHAKLRQAYTRSSSSRRSLTRVILKRRLRPILETEDILDLWLQSWDKVMAGEHRNAKLLYLIATSACSTSACGGHQGTVERRQVRDHETGVGVLPAGRHRHLHHAVGEGAAL